GTKTPYGPPERNGRDETHGGYRPLGTKPHCRPDQSWKKDVRGINQVGGHIIEYEKAQGTDGYTHGDRLGDPQQWSRETPAPAPDEEERRHHQVAHGITQPPGPPGFAKRSGRNHATEPATGYPHGGADQGTEHSRQHNQAQDIPEAVESRAKPEQA